MTYEEMLKGLSAYIKQAVFFRLNVRDALDQCLKRYVEWQAERNNVWLHIDPDFKWDDEE